MLNRLALVIHWISFLAGAGLLIIYIGLVVGGTEIRPDLSARAGVILMGFGGLVLANLAGFTIRFVLTGEKIFLPWGKRK